MQRIESPRSHRRGNGAQHRQFATARAGKRCLDHPSLWKSEISGRCRRLRRKGAESRCLATECCWGSLDDAERAKIVATELSQLRDRNLGFLAHVLHHSLVADCHRPQYGPGQRRRIHGLHRGGRIAAAASRHLQQICMTFRSRLSAVPAAWPIPTTTKIDACSSLFRQHPDPLCRRRWRFARGPGKRVFPLSHSVRSCSSAPSASSLRRYGPRRRPGCRKPERECGETRYPSP